MTNLFQLGEYILSSGEQSKFKIDCDALTDDDIKTCAYLLASKKLPSFKEVIGVPSGGLRLAEALRYYVDESSELTIIADDVFTTGGSIKHTIQEIGFNNIAPWQAAVIFSRTSAIPYWLSPLFVMYRG